MATSLPDPQPDVSSERAAPHRRRGLSIFLVEILTGAAVVGDMIFFLAGLFIAFHLRFTLPPLKYLKWNRRNHAGELRRQFYFRSCPFFPLAARSGLYSSQNMLRLRRISIALMNAAAY